MRNFKKFLTLVLAVMMVVSAMSFTTSAAFEDVAADDEYLTKAVDLLNYMGVAKGVSDTKFGTDELVTRQQFALFIYRMMKGGKDAPANGANSTNFTDLVDPTYNYAISWAYQSGIVSGRNSTTFDPKGAITLQEAYAMIVRALQYEADGEKLAYPFGYEEVATKDTVDLAEGLASDVDLTDALTRGDMAILLYNAFFAEVGVAEIMYEEEKIGSTADNTLTAVLLEKEYYPMFCEKFFDVKIVEYWVTGTPHFQVNGYDNTFDLGYDAVALELLGSERDYVDIDFPGMVYLTPDELAVEAEDLDTTFLAEVELFVKLDKDDDEIEKVLYAGFGKEVKTVNEIELATVTTNKTTSYYAGTEAKLLSGKATADGEDFYFFNAPYSYWSPKYADSNEAYRYEKRNEKNIGTVDYELVDEENGIYEATLDAYVISATAADYESTGVYADEAEDLFKNIADFDQVYYGGLYEADLYDVDGDGIYDYMDYKPYELFNLVIDEDYDFEDTVATPVLTGIPSYYTTDATLLGEKFEDEDLVIGYVDEDTRTIKVAEVIKPVTTTIKANKKSELTVTLADDTKVKVDGAWKLLKNFNNFPVVYDVEAYEATIDATNAQYKELVNNNKLIEGKNKIDFYLYDGIVLYQEGAKSSAVTFTENLLIPVEDVRNGNKTVESQFNTALSDYVTHIYAWVEGDLKWIPVKTDDVYPDIVSGGVVTDDYLNQLCTYSIDGDGVYTITSLENAEEEDGTKVGINYTNGVDLGYNDADYGLENEDDADIQYLFKSAAGDKVRLQKKIGTRFELAGDYTLPFVLNFTDDTRIVIKKNGTDAKGKAYIEFVEYSVNDFTRSMDDNSYLENVSVIVANDPERTDRENALVIYGETNADTFEIKGEAKSAAYRLVRDSNPFIDENDNYRINYTLVNLLTGKEEVVAGNAKGTSAITAQFSAGDIIELKDGKVDDYDPSSKYNVTDLAVVAADDTDAGVVAVNKDIKAGLVWIYDFSLTDGVMLVADVAAADEDWRDISAISEAFIVDDSTAITMLKHKNASDVAQWGTLSTLTANDLAAAKNEIKCYNSQVVKKNNTYKTDYAKYVKAFIITTNEDPTDLAEDDTLNKIVSITVIAHSTTDEKILTGYVPAV